MKKIYISGPITGIIPEIAAREFGAAEAVVAEMGFEPVNPLTKASEAEGKSWVEYMKEDIPMLMACEAIYMLTGWQASKGASLEHMIACHLDYSVIYAK